MNILDVSRQPVAAAASFPYRGYEISMSTIFGRGVEVAVFGRDGGPFYCHPVSVEKAIEYIDKRFCFHCARDLEAGELVTGLCTSDDCPRHGADKLRAALRFCVTDSGARCLRSPSVAGFVRRLAAISTRAADALK